METGFFLILVLIGNITFSQNNQNLLKNELCTTVGYGKIFQTFDRPPFEYSPYFLSANYRHYLSNRLSINLAMNVETFVDLKKYDDCFYRSTDLFISYNLINSKKVIISTGLGGNYAFYWLSFKAYSNLTATEQGRRVVGLYSNINIYYLLNERLFCKLNIDYELNIPYIRNTSSLRYGISFGVKF
ncbi:MAG: hypothetical protein JXL97_05200 [Bacteroidales bacterium]|nr:hypothetical protein [Bacteroidales bacterium]